MQFRIELVVTDPTPQGSVAFGGAIVTTHAPPSLTLEVMEAFMSAASGSIDFNPDIQRAPPDLFRRHWGWLLGFAIVQVVAGAVAIAAPLIASLVAVAVFGGLMLVAAFFHIMHAIRVRKWPGFALHLLGGLLYAGAGVLTLVFPFPSMLALTLGVAGLLLADGVLRLLLAARMKRENGWGWVLASGIASVVLGGMLIVGFPATALWAVGLLLGVNLIVVGTTNAAVAMVCRKKQRELPGSATPRHASAAA
jgi:uncharacterized membrane protein HdeD (DUF308 family)